MTTLSCDEELYKTKNIQPLSTAALSSTVIDEKAIKEEIFTETSADKIKLVSCDSTQISSSSKKFVLILKLFFFCLILIILLIAVVVALFEVGFF